MRRNDWRTVMTDIHNVNSLTTEDKNKLRGGIRELSDSLTRMDSEREFQKETIDSLSEDIGIEKKLIRKMAKTYHKCSFPSEQEEYKTFEEFYEGVMFSNEKKRKEETDILAELSAPDEIDTTPIFDGGIEVINPSKE